MGLVHCASPHKNSFKKKKALLSQMNHGSCSILHKCVVVQVHPTSAALWATMKTGTLKQTENLSNIRGKPINMSNDQCYKSIITLCTLTGSGIVITQQALMQYTEYIYCMLQYIICSTYIFLSKILVEKQSIIISLNKEQYSDWELQWPSVTLSPFFSIK